MPRRIFCVGAGLGATIANHRANKWNWRFGKSRGMAAPFIIVEHEVINVRSFEKLNAPFQSASLEGKKKWQIRQSKESDEN